MTGLALGRNRAGGVRAAIATLLALASGIVILSGEAAAQASTPRSAPGGGSAPDRTVVTLITGDRVVMTAGNGGHRQVDLLPAVGKDADAAPSGFMKVGSDEDLYVIPDAAAPYVGTVLDQSLFAVSRLAAAGTPTTTIRVETAGSSAVPHLPGLSLKPATGGVATGELTAANATVFGRALAKESATAQRRGSTTTRSDGLFAGIARISAPAATRPPTATPTFSMQTLTIHGIDRKGQPDNGDLVAIFNVDDPRQYGLHLFPMVDGLVKLSVPVGHYALFSEIVDKKPSEPSVFSGDHYAFFRPEVSVTKKTSLTFDARKATSSVSFSTPRPAFAQTKDVEFGLTINNGQTFVLGAGLAAPNLLGGDANVKVAGTLAVQPITDRITRSTPHYSSYSRLVDPTGGSAYTYDAIRSGDGTLPSSFNFTIRPDELATIDARYDSQVADHIGSEVRTYSTPWGSSNVGTFAPFPTPAHRTEYITGNPDVFWHQQAAADAPTFTGWGQDAFRIYRAGQTGEIHWFGQPNQTSIRRHQDLAGNTFIVPSTRQGNLLNFAINPFGDSTPEHIFINEFLPTPGLTEQRNYALWENGRQIAAGPFILGTPRFPISAEPADYRFEYDITRTAPWFPLSTRTTTDWTFHSDASQGTGTLPDGWLCSGSGETDCGIIALMFPRYQLGLDARGQADAGSAMNVELGFERTDGSQAPPPDTATFALTFDDGVTWVDEPVTAMGEGRYKISFTNPAASATNGFVGLRVSASDSSGNGVTQTTLRAYALR